MKRDLIDIDDELKYLLPWDVSLKIDGREYRTRRPTMANGSKRVAGKAVNLLDVNQ